MNETPGQAAYEAWEQRCVRVHGAPARGRTPWAKLTENQQALWNVAAAAAIAAHQEQELVKVHSCSCGYCLSCLEQVAGPEPLSFPTLEDVRESNRILDSVRQFSDSCPCMACGGSENKDMNGFPEAASCDGCGGTGREQTPTVEVRHPPDATAYQVDAPPQPSTVPPTEPGYYWWRRNPEDKGYPVELFINSTGELRLRRFAWPECDPVFPGQYMPIPTPPTT